MSATSDPHPPPARPVRASDRRDAALQDLADALALLGDDASRATEASRDVRLHIVACQSEHLSGEVRALIEAGGVHRELAVAARVRGLDKVRAPSLRRGRSGGTAATPG